MKKALSEEGALAFILTPDSCLLTSCPSPFNSERRVKTRRLRADLLDLRDARVAGADRDVVAEAFDRLGRPLGVGLDRAVGEVAHVARHLMPGGDALREEAEADALHLPADDEPACDFHSAENHLLDAARPFGKTRYAKRTSVVNANRGFPRFA